MLRTCNPSNRSPQIRDIYLRKLISAIELRLIPSSAAINPQPSFIWRPRVTLIAPSQAPTLSSRLISSEPISFSKQIGSDDISLDESVGACDGAINVTLGRQMNDGCGLIAAEDGINRSSIADISFLKYI